LSLISQDHMTVVLEVDSDNWVKLYVLIMID